MANKKEKDNEVLTQKQQDYISNQDYIKEYSGHLPCCDHVDPVVFSSKNADIYMFGKPVNWKDDFYFHTQIIDLLMKKKINKIFFPDISSFTGEICEDYDFPHSTKIEKFNLEIFQGKKTEGLIIPKNSAAFLCTADCPVVVYQDHENDLLIAAHAGLNSVIDRQYVLSSKRSRFNRSVVENIIDYLDENIDETDNYEISIIGGISHESFIYSPNDAVYGPDNKKILQFLIGEYGDEIVPLGIDHGGISIPNIIRQEFVKWSIDPNKIYIDGVDTCTDSRFWSHTEFVKKRCNIDGRNGILVIHK